MSNKQMLRKINGKKMQELIALQFEEFYPPPKYSVFSFDNYGPDIEITNKDTQRIITGEVKSCVELRYELYYNHWRRGQFKMYIDQLSVGFYVFVIRFCGNKDDNYKENGEFEVYFVETKFLRDYFSKLTITNCKDQFALGIEKLHTHLSAIQNLEEFIKKLPKI